MLGLLPEIWREKREWDKLKGHDPHPNLPQVKQFSSCQQARYDRAISLKAAAESIQTDRQMDRQTWATIGPPAKRNLNEIKWRSAGGPIVARFDMLTGRQTDRQNTNRSQHWLQSCQTHHYRLYKHQILERFQRLDQNLQHLFYLRVCR